MNEQQKRGDHNFSDVLPSNNLAMPLGFSKYDGTPQSNGLKATGDLLYTIRNWAEADVKLQIKNNSGSYTPHVQGFNSQKSILDTHNFEPEIMRSDCATSTTSK